MYRHALTILFLVLVSILANTPVALGIFIDGGGHYSAGAETRTNPGFQGNTGLQQGIDQSFSLDTEFRANDKTSFFLNWRLFEDPRAAYLGDYARPNDCVLFDDDGNEIGRGRYEECNGLHQDEEQPGYQRIRPYIQEAYARYAFDYCLLTVGRRPRDWGIGIFMDSGKDPFNAISSVYDGITCDINIQKSQTLGFSFGYDKLAETGTSVVANPGSGEVFGAASLGDDLDQFFFTIEYDDRKANAGSSFTRQIGIYFANVLSKKDNDSPRQTDVKFADVFTGFYFSDFSFRNEILFRLGKSAASNWVRYGAERSLRIEDGATDREEIIRNNVESIGVAGDLEYVLSRSGATVGPKELQRGSASSNSLFLAYAYAPGDVHGYYDVGSRIDADGEDQSGARKVGAMAFHGNYKPALLLLNERPPEDVLRVDGVYDPFRVMNATVVTTGYRYKSLDNGDFEFKLVFASLNEGMPQKVKADEEARVEAELAAYAEGDARDKARVPYKVGYKGNLLGYELDLTYSKRFDDNVEMGISGAYAIPGDALEIYKGHPAKSSYLLRSHLTVRF